MGLTKGDTLPRKEKKKKESKPVKDKSLKVKEVVAKTDNQKQYIRAIDKNTVTFCDAPAGCGKTYLACAIAAQYLEQNRVQKILLVRPAIDADEDIGYLPGSLEEKMDPYLRPLLDCFHELIGKSKTDELLRNGVIEICALGYMRGRNLKNSFVILDEAQNTTVSQMKMFLTRLGEGSKFVVNGDITQSDIEELSGLQDVSEKLRFVHGCRWVEMDDGDIVRHPVVKNILEAYNET